LREIMTDKDLRQYAEDGFWDLIQAVITSDPFCGMSAARNIKELIFHMPTILFWDKMKRYLTGTFKCYDDQVKMASKFNFDNSKYNQFVKKQIHLISELEDDQKIDYFAALTRSFLLTQLEEDLFFKLVKFISMCTVAELHYIETVSPDYEAENSAMVSSLYQYGLLTQKEKPRGGTTYVLSDFAKALKQNSLNFDEGTGGNIRLCSYAGIAPLSIAEPMSIDDIEEVWNSSGGMGLTGETIKKQIHESEQRTLAKSNEAIEGIWEELEQAYRDGVNSVY